MKYTLLDLLSNTLTNIILRFHVNGFLIFSIKDFNIKADETFSPLTPLLWLYWKVVQFKIYISFLTLNGEIGTKAMTSLQGFRDITSTRLEISTWGQTCSKRYPHSSKQ